MKSPEQFTAELQSKLDMLHLADDVFSEMKADVLLSKRMHLPTVEFIIELSGEPGMTLEELRLKLMYYQSLIANENFKINQNIVAADHDHYRTKEGADTNLSIDPIAGDYISNNLHRKATAIHGSNISNAGTACRAQR